MDPNPISFLYNAAAHRLYPAKYHFMPTQGQIQEVKKYFLLQDTFNMGILCFKTRFVKSLFWKWFDLQSLS